MQTLMLRIRSRLPLAQATKDVIKALRSLYQVQGKVATVASINTIPIKTPFTRLEAVDTLRIRLGIHQ